MSTVEQLLLRFEHEAASGLEDFMPAPCNREALAWLERWPDWPAPALVLHGPPGSGKSHLARIWAARAGARQLDAGALPSFAEGEPPVAAVLDPAEPIADELALLQLYNRLRERGGHLLVTARHPVAAWPLRLPDLASRLRAAPAVAIGAPDDALLAALLVKLFDDRQLIVSEGVIGYLIRHMERSFAAARSVVDALDRHSLQDQRPVTVALARAALGPNDSSSTSGS
jgi:chromosomal replication initiation ATPase DnaA